MATGRTSCRLLPLLAGWPLPSPPFPLHASSRSWLHIYRTPAAPHSVSFHSASRSPQSYPAFLLLLLHLHRHPQVCCRQRPRTRTRCTCVYERINSSGGMPTRAYTALNPAAPHRLGTTLQTQGAGNAPYSSHPLDERRAVAKPGERGPLCRLFYLLPSAPRVSSQRKDTNPSRRHTRERTKASPQSLPSTHISMRIFCGPKCRTLTVYGPGRATTYRTSSC
jgi:hypothetical protein